MNGSTVRTATVSIATIMRASSMSPGNSRFVSPPLPWQTPPLFIMSLLVALILHKLRRTERAARLLCASAVLACAAFCVSCTSGSGSGPPPPVQGTPSGDLFDHGNRYLRQPQPLRFVPACNEITGASQPRLPLSSIGNSVNAPPCWFLVAFPSEFVSRSFLARQSRSSGYTGSAHFHSEGELR
jgi:hypothetical protein